MGTRQPRLPVWKESIVYKPVVLVTSLTDTEFRALLTQLIRTIEEVVYEAEFQQQRAIREASLRRRKENRQE